MWVDLEKKKKSHFNYCVQVLQVNGAYEEKNISGTWGKGVSFCTISLYFQITFGGFTRFRLYDFIAEHANRETLQVLHEFTAAHEKTSNFFCRFKLFQCLLIDVEPDGGPGVCQYQRTTENCLFFFLNHSGCIFRTNLEQSEHVDAIMSWQII